MEDIRTRRAIDYRQTILEEILIVARKSRVGQTVELPKASYYEQKPLILTYAYLKLVSLQTSCHIH